MDDGNISVGQRSGLTVPIRNHYFYGQLLGVHNFELETDYGIRYRRLLNRLVLGWGVVCGLDVDLTDDGRAVVISPGLAIDRRGREIVVAQRSVPITIPTEPMRAAAEHQHDRHEHPWIQVVICYHECRADPVPVRAGDCDGPDPCAPSTIREQYRVEFRDRPRERPEHPCLPDLLSDGRIDQHEIAEWVTRRDCQRLHRDPCVPLANLAVIDTDRDPRCEPGTVDIDVRPVLASNVLLMELIRAVLDQGSQSRYE